MLTPPNLGRRHAQIRDLGLRGSSLSQWQVVELCVPTNPVMEGGRCPWPAPALTRSPTPAPRLAESVLEDGIAEALGDVEGALDDVVAAVAHVV